MPPDIDPRGTAAYRAARLAVIILSGLIILAVIALVVGGIAKLARKPAAHGDAFQLPAGAQILGTESQPGRLIVRARTRQGEEIDILDTQDGHLVRQIRTQIRTESGAR